MFLGLVTTYLSLLRLAKKIILASPDDVLCFYLPK